MNSAELVLTSGECSGLYAPWTEEEKEALKQAILKVRKLEGLD